MFLLEQDIVSACRAGLCTAHTQWAPPMDTCLWSPADALGGCSPPALCSARPFPWLAGRQEPWSVLGSGTQETWVTVSLGSEAHSYLSHLTGLVCGPGISRSSVTAKGGWGAGWKSRTCH